MAKGDEAAAPIFSALGDETRLRLVGRLGMEGPLSISELTEGTELTRQAITKHLQTLEDAQLVRGTKRGREKIWSLEQKRLEIAQAYLERMGRRWDEALGRLKAWVEEE